MGLRIVLTRHDLACGEPLPWGYREAYFDWGLLRSICYPIGIHLLIWFWRWLWNKTFFYLPETDLDLRMRLKHQRDFERAKNDKLRDRIEELERQLEIVCSVRNHLHE